MTSLLSRVLTLFSRVQISAQDSCRRSNEDSTGADELYILGALSDGVNSKGALTTPISINDNQQREFDVLQRVIFDGNVAPGAVLRGGLKAFDEDAGKNWSKYGATVTKITDTVAEKLDFLRES